MEALPQRPSPLQLLTAYNSKVRRWPGALRAALAILIPGSIALLLGYDHAVLLISAGAFAVIYGEGHPYRTRLRVMATAALLLLGASVGGLLVDGLLAGGLYAVALGVLGTFVQNALRLPPPGCFFIVMVGGGSTMITGVPAWEVGLWCAVGSLTGIILGMLPAALDAHGPEKRRVLGVEQAARAFVEEPTLAHHHQAQTALVSAWQALSDAAIIRGGRILQPAQRDLVERTLAAQRAVAAQHVDSALLSDEPADIDPSRTVIPHTNPTARYRLYRSATRNSHPSLAAQRVLVGGLLTVLIGLALGLNRPDWGAVSVLLVLQWGPDRVPGTIRGVQRMLGSCLGVCLFAAFHYFGVSGWTLLLALAACQYAAETFVVRNYAICVIFSTPLALLMGNSNFAAIEARLAEIALSVSLALAVLWLWRPRAAAQDQQRLQARCVQAMSTLLGSLLTTTPDAALTTRRDLQYELLSERRAILSLAANGHGELFWERHQRLRRAGYHLLDFCSLHPDRRPTEPELRELVSAVEKSG